MAEGDKEGKKTTSIYYWNKIMQNILQILLMAVSNN